MTNKDYLVGCIDTMEKFGNIETRFFYVDIQRNKVKDVTMELCEAVESFNRFSKGQMALNGKYEMTIPMKYKYGLAVYPYGCGLSHYLHEDTTESVGKYLDTIPLKDCQIKMFTPNDMTMMNGRNMSVFDDEIKVDILRFLK